MVTGRGGGQWNGMEQAAWTLTVFGKEDHFKSAILVLGFCQVPCFAFLFAPW